MLSLILHLTLCGPLAQAPPGEIGFSRFLDAIRVVETGGEIRPERAVGDGGRSLGPYQISRAYLADSGINGDWIRCREQKFSERVMLAYWQRHCPQALRDRHYETLARIHNGGPDGCRKTSTLKYWRLVQSAMKSQPAHRSMLAVRPDRGSGPFAVNPMSKPAAASAAKVPPKQVGNFRPLSLNQNPIAENTGGGIRTNGRR